MNQLCSLRPSHANVLQIPSATVLTSCVEVCSFNHLALWDRLESALTFGCMSVQIASLEVAVNVRSTKLTGLLADIDDIT
jgi:hypothetical protein